MQIDWKQIVEDHGDEIRAVSEPVPADKYRIRVEQSTAKVSSNGNSMIELRLKIIEGPHATRVLFFRPTLTEKSQPQFLRNLNGFGIAPDWLKTANPTFEQIASALQGREGIAVVEVDNQNRNNVRWVNQIPGSVAPAVQQAPAPAPEQPVAPAFPSETAPAFPTQEAPTSPFTTASNPFSS